MSEEANVSGEEVLRESESGIVGRQPGYWLTLHSNPHKEYAVRDFLASQGLTAYVPEELNASQRRDRPPRRPFFPHYLFLLYPGPEWVERIQWTPGLRRIVTFGNRPALVPTEIILHIQSRLEAMAATRDGPFRPGEPLVITKGPFRGLDAVFDRGVSRADRVRVFLDFAGRLEVPVELDIDALKTRN
ncbi:hypothetical protein JXA88_14315 [Candidatus Fermentibacteria bacterium]|nr:hypothetical protein [Candidatus Fermentibacteria bacterium]